MGAALNCGRTAFNFNNLGVKVIVKRTAKDTGKAILEDYDPKKKESKDKASTSDKKASYSGSSKASKSSAAGSSRISRK